MSLMNLPKWRYHDKDTWRLGGGIAPMTNACIEKETIVGHRLSE